MKNALVTALGERGLQPLGAFEPNDQDDLPKDIKCIVMVSPAADFWTHFSASHEWQGGLPDPIDRWSNRVLSRLALEFDATPYFPFTGPPYRPFFAWARRTGHADQSPVTLLVSDKMGLNTSFRGALGLREVVDFGASVLPCKTCNAPCLTACPANALTKDGYDVSLCKHYLAQTPDAPCRATGCMVRRACPSSSDQPLEQIHYHLGQFMG